jgi:3-oxoacyl-[acyl-carrier-protein] synthase III
LKKGFIVIMASLLILLSGCSLLNDAKNTITYVNDATDYLGKATTFANEAPSLARQAVQDEQAAKELETMLQEMKQEMESFNELQAPDMAADLHQQIVDQNGIMAEGIDFYLTNMENGKLDPAVLENTKLFQTVEEISNIIDQIKNIGQ